MLHIFSNLMVMRGWQCKMHRSRPVLLWRLSISGVCDADCLFCSFLMLVSMLPLARVQDKADGLHHTGLMQHKCQM